MGQMLGSTGTTAEGPLQSSDPSMGASAGMGPGAPVTTGQSGILGALASGFNKLGDITSFLGDNKDEIQKNAKALAALTKDIGAAHQTMLDSTLMRRMIQHGMAAPLAVFGGASAQGAGRIQPTFSSEAAASAGQWRGMR
jgi:hypothetical protein